MLNGRCKTQNLLLETCRHNQHHIPACITFLPSCDIALFYTCCWGDWVDFGEVIISVELVFSKEGLSFCLQWLIQGRLKRRDFLDLHTEKGCCVQNIMDGKVIQDPHPTCTITLQDIQHQTFLPKENLEGSHFRVSISVRDGRLHVT